MLKIRYFVRLYNGQEIASYCNIEAISAENALGVAMSRHCHDMKIIPYNRAVVSAAGKEVLEKTWS